MYLPRALIAKLYLHLLNTRHPLSPPVLILVALEPDALCACRILARLFKHDYIPHKIQPVAGYADLERYGADIVAPMMETRGGAGGVVICLGVGGMVDLGVLLGLDPDGQNETFGGVEVWVMDSRRPWNLANIFGGFPLEPETEHSSAYSARTPKGVTAGRINHTYKPGKGGIVIFDDGDVEDGLDKEREAYMALVDMPDVDDDGDHDDGTDDGDDNESDVDEETQDTARPGQKRKSSTDFDDGAGEDEDRPARRRRSGSSSSMFICPQQLVSPAELTVCASDAANPPGAAQLPTVCLPNLLRRRLVHIRRENEAILRQYYRLGTAYSEPIASIMYSLASELGREDNDALWLAIVGVTSMELYGRSSAGVAVPVRSAEARPASGWLGIRGARIRQLLRDEVRRLNAPDGAPSGKLVPESSGIIPTTARSPEDTSIRLSPEPKFLLIRHWSLYDSMLHSPYLFSRLKTWSETGLKRLHKLLAKMGVSLVQCKQSYTHMDMTLKRELRSKLLKYASMYNLDELVPTIDTDGSDRGGAKDGWGFVRSWGWRATLSAQDVGVVIGALLEVGRSSSASARASGNSIIVGERVDAADHVNHVHGEDYVPRFWDAYDALGNIEYLKAGLPTAQYLHKAIFQTGTTILKKKQVSHLRAFRMCVVKDASGPDAALFNHPGALTKLALWIGEALSEQEKETTGRLSQGGRGTPLVVASLDAKKGLYTVVGTGGGGGPDSIFVDREASHRRTEAKRAKSKIRQERRRAQERARPKQPAKEENKSADEDDEHEDWESEASDSGDSDSDEEDEEGEARKQRGYGLNKFGTAFQDVVAETNARVRIDSFEHCVVEVKKEDLGGFLESLSMKTVVG